MLDDGNCDNNACFPKKIIKETEWGALTSSEREDLFKLSVCRKYQVGEMIFHQADECRGLYLIREGLVSVRKQCLDGSEVIIRLARGGDTLGYRPFLADQPHLASAQVMQNSLICFFAASQIKKILLENPHFGFEFLQREARELGDAEERFQQTVSQSVRIRLIHLLLVLNQYYGMPIQKGSLDLELPISRQDMASMIGIRVESLSRTIKHLTDDGLLNFSGRHVRIHNLELMAEEISY